MSLKSEAIEALQNEFSEKAEQATSFMRSTVAEKCDRGYATGTLAGSIVNERLGTWSWRVGSHLDYASYVNDGRGVEYPRDRVNGRLYLKPPLDFWMPRGMPVKKMDGKKFIEATKKMLEG